MVFQPALILQQAFGGRPARPLEEVVTLDIVVTRFAALDMHKKTVTAYMRDPQPDGNRRQQVRSFNAFVSRMRRKLGTLRRTWIVYWPRFFVAGPYTRDGQ